MLAADKIVINKIDTATPEELKQLEETIKSINSGAEIIKASYSKVDVDDMLNKNTFKLEQIEAFKSSKLTVLFSQL